MLDETAVTNIKGALMADSIGTCVSAVLSTTTTFIERLRRYKGQPHRSDRYDHRRAVPAGYIFSPLFLTIPSFATARL